MVSWALESWPGGRDRLAQLKHRKYFFVGCVGRGFGDNTAQVELKRKWTYVDL